MRAAVACSAGPPGPARISTARPVWSRSAPASSAGPPGPARISTWRSLAGCVASPTQRRTSGSGENLNGNTSTTACVGDDAAPDLRVRRESQRAAPRCRPVRLLAAPDLRVRRESQLGRAPLMISMKTCSAGPPGPARISTRAVSRCPRRAAPAAPNLRVRRESQRRAGLHVGAAGRAAPDLRVRRESQLGRAEDARALLLAAPDLRVRRESQHPPRVGRRCSGARAAPDLRVRRESQRPRMCRSFWSKRTSSAGPPGPARISTVHTMRLPYWARAAPDLRVRRESQPMNNNDIRPALIGSAGPPGPARISTCRRQS